MGTDQDALLFDFLEKNFGKDVDRASGLASAQKLLATHEAELSRISALLSPDGTICAHVAEKTAAVRQREQEMRALEARRAELEQHMRSASGKGSGVMLKFDELSHDVAGLEALRFSLEMMARIRRIEEEKNEWKQLQELADLMEARDCRGETLKAVCARVRELVRELRKPFTDDVATAAKDLGWPKVIEIPKALQRATDGIIAEWIGPQLPTNTPRNPSDANASKKLSHEQRLEHFCRVLGRITSLQLIALQAQRLQEEQSDSSRRAKDAGDSAGSAGSKPSARATLQV